MKKLFGVVLVCPFVGILVYRVVDSIIKQPDVALISCGIMAAAAAGVALLAKEFLS